MQRADDAVAISDLNVRYGNVAAIDNVSLNIRNGEFVSLLGPSGCGKTTLLRCVGGMVRPASGAIMVGGRRIDPIPIHKRNIGFVFQNYALFPHKSVFDNIAFGVLYRNLRRGELAARVNDALQMVRLPGFGDRFPSQLSGGQQQRVALARAIAIRPDVLLLDEPLSALDANLRDEMRVEIKQIQKKLGITTIFVTHDQHEALSMSDRIAVMSSGKIVQYDTPRSIYEQPTSLFVADFIGNSNILAGTLTETEGKLAGVRLASGVHVEIGYQAAVESSEVCIMTRAHRVALAAPSGLGMEGTVKAVSYLGETTSYLVDIGAGLEIKSTSSATKIQPREGDRVAVVIAPENWSVFDQTGELVFSGT